MLSVKLCAHLFIVGANSPGQKCGKNNEKAATEKNVYTKNDIKIVARWPKQADSRYICLNVSMGVYLAMCACVCECV